MSNQHVRSPYLVDSVALRDQIETTFFYIHYFNVDIQDSGSATLADVNSPGVYTLNEYKSLTSDQQRPRFVVALAFYS